MFRNTIVLIHIFDFANSIFYLKLKNNFRFRRRFVTDFEILRENELQFSFFAQTSYISLLFFHFRPRVGNLPLEKNLLEFFHL